MIRLFLPIVLGAAVVVVVLAVFCGLELLLSSYTDYNRGLWEGATSVAILNGGFEIAKRVLRRVDARKGQ